MVVKKLKRLEEIIIEFEKYMEQQEELAIEPLPIQMLLKPVYFIRWCYETYRVDKKTENKYSR